MENAENAYLNIRQSLQQIETTIASDQIESAQLAESLAKLDIQYRKEKNSLLSELKTTYNELITSIENWEQTYLLVSPIAGTVTFNSFWTSNQFVTVGSRVLAIVPDNRGLIIGKVRSPVSGAGKIKLNQLVNIKVDGYPYMEYGTLQGRVKSVSLIPDENSYAIDVELPQNLKTITGNCLSFGGELAGQAEIITDGRSLFARIFSPLRYLLKSQLRVES
jgi:HlyD family secretion protein